MTNCEIRGEHCTGAGFICCPRCGCRACTHCLGRLLLLPCGEHRAPRTSEEFVSTAFPDLDLGDIDSAVKALEAQIDEKVEDLLRRIDPGGMIRQGDLVKFKPQWSDPGDEHITYRAVEDEAGGRVKVVAEVGLPVNPTQIVSVESIAKVERIGGQDT
jgi:hypothetical protein